jgi:hypothetical protein
MSASNIIDVLLLRGMVNKQKAPRNGVGIVSRDAKRRVGIRSTNPQLVAN